MQHQIFIGMYLSRKWSIGIFVTLMVISLVLDGLSMALYAKNYCVMVGASPYRPYSVSDNTAVLAHMETSDRISRSVQHTCPYFCHWLLVLQSGHGVELLVCRQASQHEVRAEITGKWQKSIQDTAMSAEGTMPFHKARITLTT